MSPRIPAFLLVLLLSACGSPQTHYFSLQAASPPDGTVVPAEYGSRHVPPIVVRRVILPASLDRLSIVTVGAQGQLIISDRNRWASPLDGMVQQTIASDLAARLPGQVVLPGDPRPPGQKRALAVTIRSFASDTHGNVALEADWFLLRDGTPIPGVTGSKTIKLHAASGSADNVVPAMARALSELTKDIADKIQHRPKT
ncbi:MAG: membrane integrity-associated transporter subunit PqiC [Proteobacteria bacterium]|nr:membrane integrity-associated transporter subunit PqiC [Pseudomonadota bacterium]